MLPPGTIVAYRKDRLGARFIALVSTIRLAQKFGRPFRVIWPEVDDIGRGLNDPAQFFPSDFIDAHILRDLDVDALSLPPLGFLSLSGFPAAATATALAKGHAVVVGDCFDVTPFADEDPATVAAEAQAIWASLPLAPRLAAAAATLRAALGPGATAYHLRRGDVVTDPQTIRRAWPDKFAPDEYYDRHIARSVAQGITPVIFSDDPAVEARLRTAWPTARAARDLIPAGLWTEGETDALSLIALSACARIVAAGSSAFSRAAAVLGGATHLDVVTDHPDADRAAAAAALRDRLARATPADIATAPGLLAQSVPHFLAEARRAGTLPTACAILDRLIADGLSQPFLYPLRAEAALDAGLDPDIDPDPAIRTIDLARLRAAVAIHRARQGDPAAAIQAAAAFWLAPLDPRTGTIIAALIARGTLTAANFFPLDPGPLVPLPDSAPPALAHLWTTLPAALPDIAPLLLDWSPLLGNAADRPAAPDRLRDTLGRRGDTPADRAFRLLADPAAPPGPFADLARAAPDHAALQHRLSRAADRSGDRRLARDAAEAALALDPGNPARRGWRGFMALRAGDPALALTDLSAAIAQGLALPGLSALLARTARRLDRPDVESAALDAALALVPGDGQLLRLRAEYHLARQDKDAARRDIATLERAAPGNPALAELRAAAQ